MKKELGVNKLALCVAILFTLCNIAAVNGLENNVESNFQSVPSDQVSDILTMISNTTHANYNRIKTWCGRIDVTADLTREGVAAEKLLANKPSCAGKNAEVVTERRHTIIEFAADCERELFYAKKSRQKPRQYIDAESGEILCERSVPWHNVSIGTPEYQIRCLAAKKRGDVVTARKAVKEERPTEEGCSTCGKNYVFDPRSSSISEPFWETFPRILQFIEDHGEYSFDGHSLRVEKRLDGTITEYRVTLPGMVSPGQYLFRTMVFSSEKGFNITLLETRRTDGKLFQKGTWDYEVIDNVHLPSRTTTQNFAGESAKLSDQSECIFVNSQLNQTIPGNTFSYKNLGMKEGDKFQNKIENKEYIYREATKELELVEQN